MYGSYFGSLSIVIRIDIAPFVGNSELRIPNSELILRRLHVTDPIFYLHRHNLRWCPCDVADSDNSLLSSVAYTAVIKTLIIEIIALVYLKLAFCGLLCIYQYLCHAHFVTPNPYNSSRDILSLSIHHLPFSDPFLSASRSLSFLAHTRMVARWFLYVFPELAM